MNPQQQPGMPAPNYPSAYPAAPPMPAQQMPMQPVAVPMPQQGMPAAQYGNPAYPQQGPILVHANNHRVLAIISVVFTFIFGLIALNCSWQVDKAIQAGDQKRADSLSKQVVIWAIVSIVIGVLVGLIQLASAISQQ